MAVTRNIITGAFTQGSAPPRQIAQASVRDVTPPGARGPYRIFPRFRYSGGGRDDLQCDLMLCELGDGRALAVVRPVVERPGSIPADVAAAVANAVWCRFVIDCARLLMLIEQDRHGASFFLVRACLEAAGRNKFDLRCTRCHYVARRELVEDHVPPPDEWPAEWTVADACSPTGVIAKVPAPPQLPDISPIGRLLTAPLVGPTESDAAEAPLQPARESAFGDATIGELLERVESKQAAARRPEQAPLKWVAPGEEASLADLIAGLVRDAAGAADSSPPPSPRALAPSWRATVVLTPCVRAGWWMIFGRLEAAQEVGFRAHPLAISGDVHELTRQLREHSYEMAEGWLDADRHAGLEVWQQRPWTTRLSTDPAEARRRSTRSPYVPETTYGSAISKVNDSHWAAIDPTRDEEGRP